MKPKPLVVTLALGALVFAILMPPEAYPAGKMAMILCATFAFLASLTERQIPGSYLFGGLLTFFLLLAHSLFVSIDMYRSLEFLTVLWAYYCLLGFFLYSGIEARPVAMTMVALAAIVSGYGLYQYFWGFDQVYQYIFYSASDQVVKAPALERIATRRVFSTLALPGTLWGFLVMALPFHGLLWRQRRVLDGLLIAGAALSLTAGFLTRSFGFLLGLSVVTVCWFVLHKRRALWTRLTIVLLILAIAGGAFYSARRDAIDDSNPMGLRFRNWVSAWHIFAVHPAGTGLNTYGIAYSQFMLPGANETQYAHNTGLQLLSELGYPFVAGVIALLMLVAVVYKPNLEDAVQRCVLVALAAWGLHNAIDINVYFASVGIIGVVLLGLLFAKPQTIFAPATPPRRVLVVLASLFTVAAIGFSALVVVSEELQHRAQIEYEENKPLLAIATLEQAMMVMPLNSSLYFDSGEILLEASQKMKNPEYLRAATESFRRAIALSPNKVGPHIGFGLCLSSAGNVDSALAEIAIARNFYPRSPYVQAITRLLEQRKAQTP